MASVLPSEEEIAALVPRPGSPVWRAFNDGRMLLTAGYALMLQVAHPTVGHGVHQHSGFQSDPWGRLLRTLDYVHGTIYGGPELAGEIGRRVRGMHRDIRGQRPDGSRYSAMEPGAFAWVHATLGIGVVEGRRRLARPMRREERDAFWAQWRDVGRLVGVRERDLPPTWDGAERYAAQMVAHELVWTPAVDQVLATISAASPPFAQIPGGLWSLGTAPLSMQLRATTIGMLPPMLRDRLGLTLTPTQAAIFDATCRTSRLAGPFRVGPMREFGPAWVRWRRAALERGDVASAAHTPVTA